MKKTYLKYITPSLSSARKRNALKVQVIEYKMPEYCKNIGCNKTYYFKTYGCQGNLSDSEKMAGLLEEMGFTKAINEEIADVVIFNTCAIRENAENRVYGELGRIKKFKKKRPEMIICLCGCMMQEEKTIEKLSLKYPHVDLIFGTHNQVELPIYLYDIITKKQSIVEVHSVEGDIYEGVVPNRESKYKAWVDIMYGCDEFCTYCIVPYTRGRERSRLKEAIVKEVEELASLGYQEVTLLGQNVNAYGKDLKLGYGFADLLQELQKTKIPRIRYTTSHPKDFDDETIKVLGQRGNIMPHLHLPVQSGNDEILKKMNRKYTHDEYVDKIKKLKEAVNDISITTDIIVAFPNETLSQFEDTLKLVKEIEFEGAYTFIFSPREGTPASKYPNDLTNEEKKQRLLTLNALINKYSLKGNKRFEDQVVEVLVDGFSKNNREMLTGYTPHNKLVNFCGDESLIGKIIKVKITKAYTWHLLGEVFINE